MRKEYILGDPASLVTQINSFNDSFRWTPIYIYVVNKTTNPVFLNFGTRNLPTATQYTRVVAAGDSVKLPLFNIREFGAFLPLTPVLTDTSQVVQIIIGNDPTP
jgi:hypothetical protein